MPWIAREAHEIALSAERRRADAEHENAQALRHELADLRAKYHTLKLQGFVETPSMRVPERSKPDPIKQAIVAACGNDRRLRANMERQAAQDTVAGMSRDEILLRITAGVTPDDTFAVAGF